MTPPSADAADAPVDRVIFRLQPGGEPNSRDVVCFSEYSARSSAITAS